MSKYNNRKVQTQDGIVHDSRKEAIRWEELKLMEKSGEISDLQRQVKYTLLPAQYEYKRSLKTGKVKKCKCMERECRYIADFVYRDKSGFLRVEDVKGYKMGGAYNLFVLKRKMMLYFHGIRVTEV